MKGVGELIVALQVIRARLLYIDVSKYYGTCDKLNDLCSILVGNMSREDYKEKWQKD